MDPFHERLAQVGLAALGRYGFALAGGYAVQAHGLLERPSEDVDMFTTLAAERTFPEAVRAAVKAYADAGLSIEVLLENATFARLTVRDPGSGQESKVELGIDWRQHPPTVLDIGPAHSGPRRRSRQQSLRALLPRPGPRLHRRRRCTPE